MAEKTALQKAKERVAALEKSEATKTRKAQLKAELAKLSTPRKAKAK